MTIYGPERVVMIRSGNYAYACVNIDKPVHLIAGNNVGKTTLISALQFLYIDDARQMHFSKDWEQTKRHYFPHQNSFVLFECMTPSGRQVVGVHGSGPGDGYKYKRFAYLGVFDRADYFDGDTLLKIDDIYKRLANRDMVYLDKAAYKPSLLGGRGEKTRSIGIVPLKDSSSYETFRYLLANLLRLSAIDQKRLRKVLVDVCRGKLQRPEIDIQGDFAELHTTAIRQTSELSYLKNTAKPLFERLTPLLVRRNELRQRASSMWRGIQEGQARLQSELDALTARRERTVAEQAEDLERLAAEAEIVRGRRDNEQTKIRDTEQTLVKIEKMRVTTQGVLPEFLAAECRNAEELLEQSLGRLGNARRENVSRIKAKVREAEGSLVRDKKLLLGLDTTFLAWVRRNSALSSDLLDRVLNLGNKQIISAQLGEGGVFVHDDLALVNRLAEIAQGFSSKEYTDGVIAVDNSVLGDDSVLRKYGDPVVIEGRISVAEMDLEQLRTVLRDVESQEALRQEAQKQKTELDRLQSLLATYHEYQALRQDVPRLSGELKAARENSGRLQGEYDSVKSEISALERAVQDIDAQIDLSQQNCERVNRLVKKLSAPPEAWGVKLEISPEGSTLDDALYGYQKACSDEIGIDSTIKGILSTLTAALPFMLTATEEEAIHRLDEELENLKDKQTAVNELWKSIIASLSAALRLIRNDVDKIGKEVRALNSRINARRISNLQSVTLDFQREDKLFKDLEIVESAFSMPLFVDAKQVEAASNSLRVFFEVYPKLSVEQLFDVHFAVAGFDGKVKTYEGLDKIESMGTGVTIKVLVHLALVRMLLDNEDVRLPFFLDEIGTIDDDNLAAIVECAKDACFVPILASIDHARDCVNYLYTVDGEKGNLIIDDESLHLFGRQNAD